MIISRWVSTFFTRWWIQFYFICWFPLFIFYSHIFHWSAELSSVRKDLYDTRQYIILTVFDISLFRLVSSQLLSLPSPWPYVLLLTLCRRIHWIFPFLIIFFINFIENHIALPSSPCFPASSWSPTSKHAACIHTATHRKHIIFLLSLQMIPIAQKYSFLSINLIVPTMYKNANVHLLSSYFLTNSLSTPACPDHFLCLKAMVS